MNKIFSYIMAIFLVIAVDLFHFEAPPSAAQDITGSVAAEALAEFNGDAANSIFGFGFKPELNAQGSDNTFSVTPGQVFDPVSMLLFGSGLIGLAGLGRKKIQQTTD